MNTKLLSYYLSEAVKGNAEASYKAGKLMASEGTFNEVAVQMRYIEAAKAGFTEVCAVTPEGMSLQEAMKKDVAFDAVLESILGDWIVIVYSAYAISANFVVG